MYGQNPKNRVKYNSGCVYMRYGFMRVSAVGFLFSERLKGKGLSRPVNYVCTIHKVDQDGNINRNFITSPVIKINTTEVVSPDAAKADILSSLIKIDAKDSKSKFKGATIKEGIKETEVHSLFSDKLYAVRTRDEFGKNHFHLLGKEKTKDLLSQNLYVTA